MPIANRMDDKQVFCHEYEIPIFERLVDDKRMANVFGPRMLEMHRNALMEAKRYRALRLEHEAIAS